MHVGLDLLSAVLAVAFSAKGAAAATVVAIGKAPTGPLTANMMWIEGQDTCGTGSSFLSWFPANPCGKSVVLNDAKSYSLEGCGGPLWVNKNGAFYANCRAAPLKFTNACGEPWERTYVCG